ncbi:protein translocase subunit secY/sec61 alpha [Synechococcus sp. PCC 7502]|uniref:preprotein translocase subunit SecY n=1 Tax=Synechococcus sp. PCC 7502 TaxID=1173263 RepID=UPI00029FAD6F|nr:preprotein translocase subunit SecY [Synechococcus sp. PCC 7502]AFY72917.1 protein translocase subunit secY/sec61 alpha [Synechococcus sp. PCC 7502]
MVVSKGKAPSAQETFMQMAQASGLRGRLLVTIGMLILVRLGIFLPLPGINRAIFAEAVKNNSVVNFLDIFSGGGLSALGIFALGIIPYINASIIMQLMTTALPTLENLQKNEGEAGRRKISQYTRYVALGWALLQSFGISIWVQGTGAVVNPGIGFSLETMVALTAGSMFVMWAGELVTERGVGNGASLLIFVSIVSGLPRSLGSTIALAQADSSRVGGVLLLLSIFLVMIVCIVFVQEGTRRIPIISARRQVGRKLYREQSSYLPLKLNQGGVMPIIFASSVLILPSFIGQTFASNQIVASVTSFLAPNTWGYVLFYLVLILGFSYFYSSLIVNPVDMSQNLKKMGSSVPGIRPGTATSTYLTKVLNRLTLLGAIFLGAVAIIPTAVERATGVATFSGIGATTLLILVGVAIETSKQIQTYVISQKYEGMVKQ